MFLTGPLAHPQFFVLIPTFWPDIADVSTLEAKCRMSLLPFVVHLSWQLTVGFGDVNVEDIAGAGVDLTVAWWRNSVRDPSG